jgi:hypothetical protein
MIRSFLALLLALLATSARAQPAPAPATVPPSPAPASAPAAVEQTATLVWLVIDDGTRKTVASAAQVAALTPMTTKAAERGIVLRFPELDGNDLARIDADTLWSGDPRKALAAAQRYRASQALVARLSRNGAAWNGRMTLVDAFGAEDWLAQHPDSSSVLIDATAGLADRLDKRRALAVSERVVADHLLWIDEVRSPADYGRVLKYLESLPVVEAVTPEGADGDRLLVKARLTVRLERLQQMLALGDTLRLDDAAVAPGSQAVLRLEH